MTRRLRWLPIALVLILLLFVAVKYSLSFIVIGEISEIKPTVDPLRIELENMMSEYKSGETPTIDLSNLSLPWDRLYIIEPYTQPSELDSIVGKSWRKNCFSEISTSDSYTLLVFTNNKIVIRCIDLLRNDFFFVLPESKFNEGISSKEAIFQLNEREQIIWVGKNIINQ